MFTTRQLWMSQFEIKFLKVALSMAGLLNYLVFSWSSGVTLFQEDFVWLFLFLSCS